jgi:hypothetical protein
MKYTGTGWVGPFLTQPREQVFIMGQVVELERQRRSLQTELGGVSAEHDRYLEQLIFNLDNEVAELRGALP